MEREIDLAPRHLLSWLRMELAAGARLDVRATREFLAEAGPAAGEGLEAEDGIEVLTTVGLVEVAPGGGAHWVLRLRIDDPVGDHLPDDGSVPDGPEEISLDVFEACFLASGDSGAITIETPCAADDRDFRRVFARILAGRWREPDPNGRPE